MNESNPVIPEVAGPESLSVGTRYQSAWSEHNMRISERQSVIQIYLATCGVVYGLWYTRTNGDQHDGFLLLFTTFLTLSSACLIMLHNRVIQQLTSFMARCEHFEDSRHVAGGYKLRYFYGGKRHQVAAFHATQRLIHRSVLAGILLVPNVVAIVVTRKKGISEGYAYAAGACCLLSLFLVFRGRILDHRVGHQESHV